MKKRVDARIGKRMEKVILRAVADYGPAYPGSDAYAVIAADLFRRQNDEKLQDEIIGGSSSLTETMNGLLLGMVGDGLLYSLGLGGTAIDSRGLTVRGWGRLYQLEHPWRVWLGLHGWSAAIAGAAVLSSVTATVTLIISVASP